MKIKHLFLALFFAFANANAQNEKTITKDSILYYFKKYNPFDALEKIRRTDYNGYIINYDALRSDKELKTYFLKCLNQKEYFEYYMKKEDSAFIKHINENSRFLKDQIGYDFVNTKRRKEIDSILKSPVLATKFKDSIASKESFSSREGKSIEKYYPNMELLIRFHYPEVYSFIKNIYNKYYREYDRQRNNTPYDNSPFFYDLLRFNDPEIQQEYDSKLQFILKIGSLDTSFDIVFKVETAYALNGVKDYLLIDREVTVQSDGLKYPYNCQLAEYLISTFKDEKIEMSPAFKKEYDEIENNPEKSFIDKCPVFKKYNSEILLHIDALKEKRRKKEAVWMKEMSFYKKLISPSNKQR
ncbi:hypothetical protein DNC80_10315 [Flavobacterium sp. SOK18b]|uniref:hypothetical protein n=1 Tax=Flavobacterium sp. SOK18b TaxID=797900 RepID=UPI0015FD788D|nr:hypothetical protein [Flavobacterium sp. SOK18b]MBB1194055.1 hypothetical protein [Flavobacterium sp. SOK18b]